MKRGRIVLVAATLVGAGACVGTSPEPQDKEPASLPRVPLALDVELHEGGAVIVYAREADAPDGCPSARFPAPEVCGELGDVPCGGEDGRYQTAPCVERIALRVGDAPTSAPLHVSGDVGVGDVGDAFARGDTVSLELEGCGPPATVALPAPTREPPRIDGVALTDDGVRVTLEEPSPLVVTDHLGLLGFRCGLEPTRDVVLDSMATAATRRERGHDRFVAPWVPLVDTQDESFGALRVAQVHPWVRAVARVGDPFDGPQEGGYLLPIDDLGCSIGGVHLATMNARGEVYVQCGPWWPGEDADIERVSAWLERDGTWLEVELGDGRTFAGDGPRVDAGASLDRLAPFGVSLAGPIVLEEVGGDERYTLRDFVVGSSTALVSSFD